MHHMRRTLLFVCRGPDNPPTYARISPLKLLGNDAYADPPPISPSLQRAQTDYDEVQFDSVLQYGGHATQILWKATEQVGCVVAECTNGGTPYTFLVCQYDPP